MTSRAGHACRTKLEAEVCGEMSRQRLPHEHRSLRFRVEDGEDGSEKYEPAIVARRGSILFLIEPMPSIRAGAVERLVRFLEQHSPEIVLLIVAADTIVDGIPRDAYDEIYPASALERMTARIREQDPEGIIRPFEKPKSRPGGRNRDTDK